MRTLALFAVGVLIAAMSGCGSDVTPVPDPNPKAVRAAFMTEGQKWKLSVNAHDLPKVPPARLMDYLPKLHLKHGDVIVVQTVEGAQVPRSASASFDQLLNHCSTNQVAVYVLPTSWGSVFSLPLFHWSAPFDNPRILERASFFLDGTSLGSGTNGFDRMVKEIERTRTGPILILGSLYNWDSGLGPQETPYEEYEERVRRAVQKSRTVVVHPAQLP